MTQVSPLGTTHVRTHGTVAPETTAYALEKLEVALRHAPGPVLHCWLTLDAATPGDRIDASANVNGVHVHVHAIGETMQEATDLMQERLRSRLRRIRRRPDQGPAAPDAA